MIRKILIITLAIFISDVLDMRLYIIKIVLITMLQKLNLIKTIKLQKNYQKNF